MCRTVAFSVKSRRSIHVEVNQKTRMGLENSHNYCASSKLKDHLRATKDALQVCALGPPFPAAILGNLRDGCSRKCYRFHSPLSTFLFNCICSHFIELFSAFSLVSIYDNETATIRSLRSVTEPYTAADKYAMKARKLQRTIWNKRKPIKGTHL